MDWERWIGGRKGRRRGSEEEEEAAGFRLCFALRGGVVAPPGIQKLKALVFFVFFMPDPEFPISD